MTFAPSYQDNYTRQLRGVAVTLKAENDKLRGELAEQGQMMGGLYQQIEQLAQANAQAEEAQKKNSQMQAHKIVSLTSQNQGLNVKILELLAQITGDKYLAEGSSQRNSELSAQNAELRVQASALQEELLQSGQTIQQLEIESGQQIAQLSAQAKTIAAQAAEIRRLQALLEQQPTQ